VYMLFNTVVNYAFFGVLFTAFVYAMFTKWGFFKHRWITVKWIGMVVIFVLVWFWIGPAINGTASLSDGGFHLTNPEEYRQISADSRLFLMLEGGIVLFLCLISFLKPWGTRKKEYKLNRKLIIGIVGLLIIGGVVNTVMTMRTLQKYRRMEIAHADVATLADGVYRGEAEVGSFTYKAEVTVQNHRITDVQFLDQRDSPYARYAEGVAPKMIAAQSPNVDTVTGATTTSKALMKAVEQALTNPTLVK
jgi:uncharacterized protein with FMN-binding domain